MKRKPAIVIALIVLAGCGKTQPPGPAVSIDTQAELVHDHMHLHGDPHRHDHQHEDDFRGKHSHGHSHGHRHAASPHQGVIVSLRLTRGDPASGTTAFLGPSVPDRPHLEIVPEFPGGMTVYFLAESSGGMWDAWETGSAEVKMEMSLGASDLRFDFLRGESAGSYAVRFDDQAKALFGAEIAEFSISNLKIKLGGLSLDSPDDPTLSMRELDELVD